MTREPSDLLARDALVTLEALAPQPWREDFIAFVHQHSDALDRTCEHGHLTASALIVDPTRQQVLLMLHRKVGRWLQMGGHLEAGDLSLRDAALREAREESGIHDLDITTAPVALDRHAVVCDGRQLDHLDVQFLAIAPPTAAPRANAESHAVQWFTYADAPTEDTAVAHLVRLARSLTSQH